MALGAAAFFAAVGSAAGADQRYGPASSRAEVLVFHGGSYWLNIPGTEAAAVAYAGLGFRAVMVDYTLNDLTATLKYVRDLAKAEGKKYKWLYAYGDSAGGGLSALLAAQGLVDGAFAWAPTVDLVRWQSETQPGFHDWRHCRDYGVGFGTVLKDGSAITYASKRSSPLVVLHGTEDSLVPIAQSLRLKAKWPNMILCKGPGGHGVGPTVPAAVPFGTSVINRLYKAQRWTTRLPRASDCPKF
jgi:acetyl esterase/lipase